MIYTYAHEQEFKGWKKPDFKEWNGKLILWGAGKIGGMAAHCLKKRGVEFIGFCDIAKDKWGTTFCGHKVISPDELKREYPKAAILISNVFHNSVWEQLITEGYQPIFDCTSLFMEIDFDGYDFWMEPEYAIRNVEQYLAAILEQKTKKSKIDQIFLNITTKCTLRCKNCSLFIPYISSPVHYEKNDIIKDFKQVLDAFGHVRVVNFYGGEPLLHPKLSSMLQSLYQEERVERISIITNGTLLPGDDLIHVMKGEERILMRISDYGPLSSKLERLKEILEKNHIRYEVANYTYWDETSKIGYQNSTEEKLISKFKHCTACNVLFLLNRKLYLCSTGSALCNEKIFPDSQNNYIDLSNSDKTEEQIRRQIIDFMARPKEGKYLDACRYCSGNHCIQFEHKVPVAEQADGILTFEKLY